MRLGEIKGEDDEKFVENFENKIRINKDEIWLNWVRFQTIYRCISDTRAGEKGGFSGVYAAYCLCFEC